VKASLRLLLLSSLFILAGPLRAAEPAMNPPPIQTGYAPVNGLRLYYEIHGKPDPTRPTLVLAGDADVVRPEHAVSTYRLLPHARLAVLPGTDHMNVTARPEWLAPMIGEFLDAPLAK